jgi:hypothetical protein
MSRLLHGSAAVAHALQAGAFIYFGLQKGSSLPTFPLRDSSFGKTYRVSDQHLFWLVPTFSLCSTFNHAVTAYSPTYYAYYQKTRTNPLQWAEYSVSAGLMTWLIATLSGIIETHVLVALVGLNVLLQYLGYLIEVHQASKTGRAKVPALMALAWGVFAIQWEMIVTSFWLAVTADSERKPPDIVYSIIFIMFTLFASFGVNQLLYVRGRISWETYQKVTVGLSFTAKSALIWMVYGGLVGMPQERISELYQNIST